MAKVLDRTGAVGGRGIVAPSARAFTHDELAWLALVPCAAVLVLVVLALGPPLGHALLEPAERSDFWPGLVRLGSVRPEPTEHARYLLALLGPVLVAGVVAVLATRPRVPAGTLAGSALVTAGRAALALVVVAAVVYQHRFTYDASYTGTPFRTVYLTAATLVVAGLFAALASACLRRPTLVARLGRALRDTPAKRGIAWTGAIAFVAAWLLSAFNTDTTLATVNFQVWGHVPHWIDEAFSVLDGDGPLVDFHAQYGQLWSYLAAGALVVFGTSFAAYAGVMLAGTAAALLAVFATFHRLAGSALVALLLFLPFVATGFFMKEGPLENRYGPAALFSLFPVRYAGAYLLLWWVVRRAERRSTRSPVPLFLVAGLCAINNVEFGIPAFGACLVALAATVPARSPAAFARLAGSAIMGATAALAAVAALTLLVAGSLPHLGMLTTFPRLFGVEGFGSLPVPSFGFHLVPYLTFAAAIVLAATRAVGREREADPALTGALAWAGVFGLGAGAYFMGRSHPHVLIDLFSPWALALIVLAIATVRGVLASGARRPSAAELLVLAGLGVTICSLVQTPTPWSQLERLTPPPANNAREVVPRMMRNAVAHVTEPGEPIALLMLEGHRIAADVGVRDVAPYANLQSMPTVRQWEETVAALRRAGGTKLLAPRELLLEEQIRWMRQAGYEPAREAPEIGLVEFRGPP